MKQLDTIDSEGRTVRFVFREKQYRENLGSLNLRNLTPLELRTKLSEAPAKFAYWSAVRADVLQVFREKKLEYEIWHSSKFSDINSENPRWSGGAKDAEIVVLNASTYKKRKQELNDLEHANDVTEMLTKAFEMQSRALQSVGSLLKAEMENLES